MVQGFVFPLLHAKHLLFPSPNTLLAAGFNHALWSPLVSVRVPSRGWVWSDPISSVQPKIPQWHSLLLGWEGMTVTPVLALPLKFHKLNGKPNIYPIWRKRSSCHCHTLHPALDLDLFFLGEAEASRPVLDPLWGIPFLFPVQVHSYVQFKHLLGSMALRHTPTPVFWVPARGGGQKVGQVQLHCPQWPGLDPLGPHALSPLAVSKRCTPWTWCACCLFSAMWHRALVSSRVMYLPLDCSHTHVLVYPLVRPDHPVNSETTILDQYWLNTNQ